MRSLSVENLPEDFFYGRLGDGRSPLAAANATFALKAAPKTRRVPAIILLLIGCLPPGKVHLIRAPAIRGPPQSSRRITRFDRPSPLWPSGMSASSALPRTTPTPGTTLRLAAAHVESPDRMAPRGLPGRNGWRGWGRSFRSSALGCGSDERWPHSLRCREGPGAAPHRPPITSHMLLEVPLTVLPLGSTKPRCRPQGSPVQSHFRTVLPCGESSVRRDVSPAANTETRAPNIASTSFAIFSVFLSRTRLHKMPTMIPRLFV